MTKPKKAILWGQDDLLAQAMEIFLLDREAWEVIRIPVEQGTHALIRQAKKIKPDAIFLCREICINDTSLPMQLIQDQPNLKVITVSLEDNEMQVYSRQSIIVRELSDLLSIIEDRYLSDHPAEKEVHIGKTHG